MKDEVFVFQKEHCIVTGPQVDRVSLAGKGTPRWGSQAGNVIGGLMGPAIQPKLNEVTVTHVPTGLSVTESKHMAFRNKDIAFIKLEAMVNAWIEENVTSKEEG